MHAYKKEPQSQLVCIVYTALVYVYGHGPYCSDLCAGFVWTGLLCGNH